MNNIIAACKINGYLWTVVFVVDATQNTYLKDNDGYCDFNDFTIYIRKELSLKAQEKVLIHELTHACLDTQGRLYQEQFNVEDLCEFVAYCSPQIIEIANDVIEQLIHSNDFIPKTTQKEAV